MSQDEQLSNVITQYNELGQLASGVGHHVINAFSAIVSNAELLRLLADAPPGRIDPKVMAETIIRTSLDASTVARRLIDYSRMATAIGESLVALDQLVADVVAQERQDGPGVNVQWATHLAPVPPIQGNEPQLRTMLGHLLSNAYEAMPKTGGLIELTTAKDDHGWVVLELRDTGQGMAVTAQERAVEPFFTTKKGHVGVGLSIANGIWRRHHGTLALRSQPGEGTKVRLCVESLSAQGNPIRSNS